MSGAAASLAEAEVPSGIDFGPSRHLPPSLFRRAAPVPVAAPSPVAVNAPLARQFRLDPEWLQGEGVALLAGNRLPLGAEPVALGYAGHQFGHFVPSLGDGRALLLGQLRDAAGHPFDIQLKGSGLTPFSRGGDGRAPLGPVLREYLVSEAMAALGVPTTRSLMAFATGETVARERPEPGGILVRIAASHIRIGSFQYLAIRNDRAGLRQLADFVINRHYPELAGAGGAYLALLQAIVGRQAQLVAKWMLLGFVHGVMNTDNVLVSGETIDYGPCAFLDAYEPGTWFSSIDRDGRYAYDRQPSIAQWNLARLGEAFAPLLADQQYRAMALAQSATAAFEPAYAEAFLTGIRAKLGLFVQRPEDGELARSLLTLLADNGADFTLTFRHLASALPPEGDITGLRRLFIDQRALDEWLARWRMRLGAEPPAPDRAARMIAVNPLVIPRNHNVNAAINAATAGDFRPFRNLLEALSTPFVARRGAQIYAAPPTSAEQVKITYCGT